MGFGVNKINIYTKEMTRLYSFIEKIKDAELLSQYAMGYKNNDEIIIIMPSFNRGIHTFPELYKKTIDLAIEHKVYMCAITGKECYKENITDEHGDRIKPCQTTCKIGLNFFNK